MKKLRWAVIAAAAVLSAGCNQGKLFVSPADEQVARGYLDQLKRGNLAAIERAIDPSIKTADLHRTLETMSAAIPDGEPLSVKLVGAMTTEFTSQSSTTRTSDLTYEFEYPKRWLVANVAVKHSGGSATIVGLHVRPLPDSLEHTNRFTLSGKPPLDYAVLALAILIPLFIIYVLIVAVRTPAIRRKWLWIVFILFGVGHFGVNWTTGEWGLQLLMVQLFGASVANPGYGPWTLAVSLPLGAILFLLRRKSPVAGDGSPGAPVPPERAT
jgi:hypothetical protein